MNEQRQDEDGIRRLVDFLLEVGLDIAEFTIMTPFPHSPIREQLERAAHELGYLDSRPG
mgnify:CR=1 FL=1